MCSPPLAAAKKAREAKPAFGQSTIRDAYQEAKEALQDARNDLNGRADAREAARTALQEAEESLWQGKGRNLKEAEEELRKAESELKEATECFCYCPPIRPEILPSRILPPREAQPATNLIIADGTRKDLSGDIPGATPKDHMIAHASGSILRGKKGRDTLEGGEGQDFLSGGNARDILTGGRNSDRLQGGRQDDRLTGGTGQDTFVFKNNHGRDTITDFTPGKDTIEIRGAEFSDLTIKKWKQGTGARVEWEEGEILLEGVDRDDLTEDNFEFV
ncbi:MAG: hypothetical protein GDA53_08655 [Rhodobacteraceae bacterium]|nr:hypothetical protein [Paracoccaceae bacterium]